RPGGGRASGRGEGAEGRRAARPVRPAPQAGEGAGCDRRLRGRRARLPRGEPRRGSRGTRARRVEAHPRPRQPHRGRGRGKAVAGGSRRPEPRGAPRGARGRQAGDRRRAEVKVLALDYGSARTGVAVSDPSGTIARPLEVVERAGSEAGLARLAQIVREQDAERIVVGLPLTLRGEHGAQAEETDRFVEALAAAVDVPVERFDERFTAKLAGPGPGSDARAAAHLLDSHLA